MYEHYKPLRNFLAKRPLFSSFFAVWEQTSGIADSRIASPGIRAYDWELELLAREIVLNCDPRYEPDASIGDRDFIAKGVGHIRRINDAIARMHRAGRGKLDRLVSVSLAQPKAA